MAVTGELARVKARNLKSIFWKLLAIYKISSTSLDSGRDLGQFEALVYVITPLVSFKFRDFFEIAKIRENHE